MAFAEDLTVFLADFGVDATLAGESLRAIVDTSSTVEVDGVVTQQPTALIVTSHAPAAAPAQAFVASAVTYSVRQVLREPPDGVFTTLVLAR